MADNPRGYGHYVGHYPPPTSFPSTTSSSSTQPPYYYPASQVGPVPPANYTTSQSAYDHNSNRIPGLGLGGTQIAPTTTFSPSAPQPWPAQGHSPQINSYFQQSQQRTPASLPQQPHLPYQPPESQSQNTLEEGELSEGEFEDLYEPKALTDAPKVPPQNKPTQSPNNLDSSNGSVGDADGSSIYDPRDPHVIHDESVVQARSNNLPGVEQDYPADDDWEPSYPDRERSGSYSPYLSPREVHRKFSIAKAMSRDTKGEHLPTTSSTMPQSNGISPVFSCANSNPVPTSASEHEPRSNSSLPFRSPVEAKKKAQEAILGLWPLKVRYQDYIDEGVDANVVKALFKDIGLDVPISKTTTAPSKTTNDAQPTPTKATPTSKVSHKSQSPLIIKTQVPSPGAKQPDNKGDKIKGSEVKAAEKSAAEERKDKIARKLAAMAQKTTAVQPPGQGASVPTLASVIAPVPVPAPDPTSAPTSAAASTPASTPASAPAPTPAPVSISISAPAPAPTPIGVAVSAGTRLDITNTPPPAPKTRAENNAILQQKLAALKRQQAQLAADKARATSNESTMTSSPAAVDPGPSDVSRNGDSTPKARSTTSARQGSDQQNSLNEPEGNSKDEGIPGLSFPLPVFPQSTQGSSRSLKRPVASDFDNYTPRLEPPKRTRTDERLVIDVSDDDDVEMDMGSPTDEFPPAAESITGPARQALSSFPPLSDGPNRRQRESPVSSSAPTPPVNGARIDLLHKRIEETKRLIAEAEAKKAAKIATTQLSPKPSSPAAQQPFNLPRVIENNVNNKRAFDNRRDIIVSYELPRISATLKEKQDKLKLLVAEAARLELEVQASLDEQHKLTAEMECLVEPSTAISPGPEEQQEQFRVGKYSELELRLPPRPAHLHIVSPHPAQATASYGQHDSREERLIEPQLSSSRQSPVTGVDGDVDTELKNDEALQAAIFTDNTHTIDLQMTDADSPAPATDDNTPVVNEEALTTDISPSCLETSGSVQPPAAEAEREMEQATWGVSTDPDIEAESMAESAPLAVSTPSSDPDDESSESDVSMQQSAPELSQSDDESYEPTPAEISESHGAQKDERNNAEVMKHLPFARDYSLTKCQAVDDIWEEPNPNHTSADQNHQEPENISNEVKNRSYKEPLLLTTLQDVQDNKPPLEDLLSYKSPLSYFRAYRFHPKYFEEVPGGLKSMSFSARIDPMREVCPQVLSGEPCPNGSSCEYQHFDSMVLADAEIITQLGSAEMFVGETRTKFIEGLKRVLNELKANRVKDFDRITKAIVKHRQEFLGDKTKVLSLDSSAT
ncbi:hypothetical protein E0Z10_g6131 [Xylaria hypoxylon]|uniref:C3H1-type domain-containing protein n=1 Tax=Xylaria hypoxylon TaxID=37992 RepID=A0A4Z0YEH6_9PEZI|nr:hypothetical protein E0Z10_g6131 [Xylaria hypoxylon]